MAGRCLLCGDPVKAHDLCPEHYSALWLRNGHLELVERERAAKVKAFRELRKTMTDGELADQILRDHGQSVKGGQDGNS